MYRYILLCQIPYSLESTRESFQLKIFNSLIAIIFDLVFGSFVSFCNAAASNNRERSWLCGGEHEPAALKLLMKFLYCFHHRIDFGILIKIFPALCDADPLVRDDDLFVFIRLFSWAQTIVRVAVAQIKLDNFFQSKTRSAKAEEALCDRRN